LIPFGELEKVVKDLKRGRLQIWKEVNKKNKKEILNIVFKYGIYHLGDWLNLITDILPFEINP
jgi:hypothetical protein